MKIDVHEYKYFHSKPNKITPKSQNSGHISTKIYDQRNIFNFNPYLFSNIPSSPAYSVYISQLIRYARECTNYSDFLERHKYLRNRLLNQGYEEMSLKRSLTSLHLTPPTPILFEMPIAVPAASVV